MISIIALALVSFNIPAGPADSAVRQFVEQAGMSVIYNHGRLDRFETRDISGQYEPLEALHLLLEGSGLNFSMTTSRFVSVNPVRHRPPRAASISPQHICDCKTIHSELGTIGTVWCTWRDEGTLGVDDRCRKGDGIATDALGTAIR